MRNVGNQFGQLEYHGENLQPEPSKWISNWLIINHKVCAFVTCVLVCALRFPHQWSSVLINFEITPKCRRGRGCGFSISISVHAFTLLNFHSVLPLSLSLQNFQENFRPRVRAGRSAQAHREHHRRDADVPQHRTPARGPARWGRLWPKSARDGPRRSQRKSSPPALPAAAAVPERAAPAGRTGADLRAGWYWCNLYLSRWVWHCHGLRGRID